MRAPIPNRRNYGGWIVCQLGAREHYAVARALYRKGGLEQLLTDLWLRPGNPLGQVNSALRSRFHAELLAADVYAPNLGRIGIDLVTKIRERGSWPGIVARNKWFQAAVARRLSRLKLDNRPRTIVAYSYAALEIFKLARKRGWKTVLAQIDPGPLEDRLVSKLYESDPFYKGCFERPSPQYWSDWREECELAERIVVNSTWSSRALVAEGIERDKIRVIPLAYEGNDTGSFQRKYPNVFTTTRPLRVLFLGQINLRKGAAPLFGAINLLREFPLEFTFVGGVQVPLPAELRDNPRVRWIGPVSHAQAEKFYRDADLFVFPTFSDGFGLTQLEAQAWQLPVIASRCCGEVVEDGRNGWLLPEITPGAIADVIRSCCADPRRLQQCSKNSAVSCRFGLKIIGDKWMSIFE